MNDTSDADKNTVACPTCDSPNTVRIAARGLQYQCRDCSNEFDSSAGPMVIELG
jgi:ribosomal protein L37AE/L43A